MNATVNEEAEQAPEVAQTVQEPEQDEQTTGQAVARATPDTTQPRTKEGREAAKYRRRLREAETALQATKDTADKAQALLTESRRQIIMRATFDLVNSGIVSHGYKPRDFYSEAAAREALTPEVVDAMFDEDGELNQTAAHHAMRDMAKARPWLFREIDQDAQLLPAEMGRRIDNVLRETMQGKGFEGSVMGAYDNGF